MGDPEISYDILRLAEATVFASPEPVTAKLLGSLLPEYLDPIEVLKALQEHCADRGVILVEAGDGWAFRTAPDLAANLQPALTESRRLPRVAMETLVIISLHQPITRSDIEQIRGVGVSQLTMDVLMEAGLIKPWGRKEATGRPSLWVTTERFLVQFGLRTLRDLPGSHLFGSRQQRRPEDEPTDDSFSETREAEVPRNGEGG